MKNLAGKVAFVTGGASGIGLAMARSFLAAGMKVAISDVEQAALESIGSSLPIRFAPP
jgi:NAD(P)-dependent dehydrogenase (short-subunit alcohol dehydrogenase family)